MAILRYIIPVVLCAILTSCYEDFTPDIDTRPVLCVNSLITAGQPIKVEVSRTRLYSEDYYSTDTRVTDAITTVSVNGKAVDESYIPAEGDNIRIEVSSREYGHAEAEVTVPYRPTVEEPEWTAVATSMSKELREDGTFYANISFNVRAMPEIKDGDKADNYFNFSYYGFSKSLDESDYMGDIDDFEWENPSGSILSLGTFRYEAEPIFGEHIGIIEAATGIDADGFSMFTDRQFAGKSYKLHIQFDDMRYTIGGFLYDESYLDCGLCLVISSVTESFYNWANYCWQKDGGILGDLGGLGLADPVAAYSNVSTGAGVVAAQTQISYTINFKDFLQKLMEE